MDEQKKDDEHKKWCDQELKKTSTLITNKNLKIEELKKAKNVEIGKIAELTEEITKSNKKIADTIYFMNNATEIRETGKRENKLAVKDAEAAQTALQNAI